MAETRDSELLRALSSGPLADLAPLRRFSAGDCLARQGEHCEHIQVVARGKILLCRTTPEGEESALYLLGAGDLYGEGSLHPSRKWLFTPRAVEAGAVHCLPAVYLARMAQHFPQLTTHIVTLMSVRLEWAHQRVELIKSAGARERLLALARHLAETSGVADGSGYWVSLPLTQAELGSLAGLARETVVRTLAELEVAGLVRRDGRRGLWVATEHNLEPT